MAATTSASLDAAAFPKERVKGFRRSWRRRGSHSGQRANFCTHKIEVSNSVAGHDEDGFRLEQGGGGEQVPERDGPRRRREGLVRGVHGQVEDHVVAAGAGASGERGGEMRSAQGSRNEPKRELHVKVRRFQMYMESPAVMMNEEYAAPYFLLERICL